MSSCSSRVIDADADKPAEQKIAPILTPSRLNTPCSNECSTYTERNRNAIGEFVDLSWIFGVKGETPFLSAIQRLSH